LIAVVTLSPPTVTASADESRQDNLECIARIGDLGFAYSRPPVGESLTASETGWRRILFRAFSQGGVRGAHCAPKTMVDHAISTLRLTLSNGRELSWSLNKSKSKHDRQSTF
jgi:hypothetical protein